MTLCEVKDRRCGNCQAAAFDDGGVYCKEFHESIFDERVAMECGAFEPDLKSATVQLIVRGSTPVVPKELDLADMFERYLEGTHSQLWGKSWSIWQDEGRRACAEWLAGVFDAALNGGGDG